MKGENGHTCSFHAYKQRFEKKLNNCNGCPGKTFSITEEEAENRVVKGNVGQRIIITLENCCQALLPYISFFYTLLISMFINKK